MFWDFGQLLQGLFAAFAILAAFARVFSQLLQEGGGGQRGRRAEGGGEGVGEIAPRLARSEEDLPENDPSKLGVSFLRVLGFFSAFASSSSKVFLQGFLLNQKPYQKDMISRRTQRRWGRAGHHHHYN